MVREGPLHERRKRFILVMSPSTNKGSHVCMCPRKIFKCDVCHQHHDGLGRDHVRAPLMFGPTSPQFLFRVFFFRLFSALYVLDANSLMLAFSLCSVGRLRHFKFATEIRKHRLLRCMLSSRTSPLLDREMSLILGKASHLVSHKSRN
jgi:hypothetical protein